MIEATTTAAKPFVKWAGGKGQLLPQLKLLLPQEFNSYFEPFVGGGALYFSLDNLEEAHINDINQVLVNIYRQLQQNVDEIIRELKVLEEEYLTRSDEDRSTFFYEKRSEYNTEKLGIRKTVLLLFLNRTCFNGLYRENSKGEFNVPFGKYKNPTICNEDNLRAISDKLQTTTITSTSYLEAVKGAKKGDFLYFDPPYQPLNETSSFTAYHQDGFTVKDQEDLRDLFVELDKRGCYVMLSNSDTPKVRDLYKGYNLHEVRANRAVNSKANGRGKIVELLITNY